MPNNINVGRYAGALTKLLSMKEPGSAIPALATEIFPVLELESAYAADRAFLMGEKRSGFGASVAAVAGEVGAIKLRNPASSGVIAVVEEARFCALVSATTHLWGLAGDTDLAASGNSSVCDGRYGVTGGNSACKVSSATSSGSLLSTQIGIVRTNANDTLLFNPRVVLPPGTGFVLQSNSVNIGILYSFVWRERAIEPSELR